ncbi:IS701 family transposase [Kribbella sp. NBC_00889]|uniref:IS701 family transposase n=1 Tax=Kribbella sp. NBC_00889 TaxID=2975974 RepID=UPI00386D1699|nr:IS701 family transposase [Kribbella sp. NBC_00889]
MGRIALRFVRVEPRRRVGLFLVGLLAGLPRVNCWTIAEHAGEASPDGMQHLLARAVWDADAVRDDLRTYVLDHLGDPGAVLVVDETGDLKKGVHTVGVQRQYTGTAGRIENAQVGVYLVYAATGGHAFIDRALYLPKSWTMDPERCRAAGEPGDTRFATKPALAREMITRALDAAVPASWVAGDEVHGGDSKLRIALQERAIGYVLAVACDHQITTPAGKHPAKTLARRRPSRTWNRLSAGVGAKGHRWYDWALIDIAVADAEGGGTVGGQALLVRRSISTGELAFYRCYTPTPVPLATLVAVAGRRWTIEESFQAGKGLTGLDEHQIRRWTSWHRWTILAMLAHAFLAVMTATARAETPSPQGLIALTANEIRHLFTRLLNHTQHGIRHLLHWSRWRRRHQARARDSHHRRQTVQLA